MMNTNTNRQSWPARAVVAACAGFAFTAQADDDALADKHAAAQTMTSAASFVPAAAGKHNGSGIRLAYRAPAQLQPGQAATVELQFSGVAGNDARAEWRAPDGNLAAAGSAWLPLGETTTVSVVVAPTVDGMAYLDVFTSQNGRSSARSIPLRVGTGRVVLKTNGSFQITPAGERVISLPSQRPQR